MSVAHQGNPVVVCTASRTDCTPCTMTHGSLPVTIAAACATPTEGQYHS
ncbi:hypothetical protein PF003_g10242 [Phytophthora fragariae]|nr:hypothetical protein PF003_g10242 [Phytophthora fragariae]